MDLASVTSGLEESEPGLWVANSQVELSYPESGHQNLMEIEDKSFWYRHRSAAIARIVDRYPPPGCVFDVGGGNGHVTRQLRNAGHEAIVVEPGPFGARTALDRGLAPVVQATTETAGFAPGTMPAIGIFDVLEHMEDDARFLAHLRGLLQPGGRLYVTVPAYPWLWSVDDVVAQHFRRYTAKSLRAVAEAAGFLVDFDTYLFSVLPLPILLVRTLPSRLGRRSGDGSRSGEHTLPGGPVGRIFQWTLDRELGKLTGGRVGFGSSVLMVATARS